jgi:cell volume regulation protein A
MSALDSVSISILFGSILVLAGIMSSLIALRFGAPLLLVFLLVGMLAGESGIGGVKFDDVQVAYTVGSVALGLILFDGGLRTRLATFRNVIAPAGLLATVGVLVTAALTAPVAAWALQLNWIEALLVGAVMASTDAAAVFFLLHAKGLRLRPRVSATLEVESGINDPFAIFLTIILVEILLSGSKTWSDIALYLAQKAIFGGLIGWVGGRAMVMVLNRLGLPQGLHAPFVATGALVVFGFAEAVHGSGFLAVYVAGLVVGNRETRAHNTVVAFLDAATWLAQIAMFVLLGLLAWPERLPQRLLPALLIALALMMAARPAAVFVCLAPFRFSVREKLFISWVGLRGAVSVFLASIPLLVGLPGAHFYFDVAFVVVLVSLAVQGWTIAAAARLLRIAMPRADVTAHRTELDLPGQLAQELVGYPVNAGSPYLRRGISPSWAKLTLVVRDERVHTPEEAATIREGDHVYLLAPPERAQALDRFFVDKPRSPRPTPAWSRTSSCRASDARRAGGNLRADVPPIRRRSRWPIILPTFSRIRRAPATPSGSVRWCFWRTRLPTAAWSWSACNSPSPIRCRARCGTRSGSSAAAICGASGRGCGGRSARPSARASRPFRDDALQRIEAVGQGGGAGLQDQRRFDFAQMAAAHRRDGVEARTGGEFCRHEFLAAPGADNDVGLSRDHRFGRNDAVLGALLPGKLFEHVDAAGRLHQLRHPADAGDHRCVHPRNRFAAGGRRAARSRACASRCVRRAQAPPPCRLSRPAPSVRIIAKMPAGRAG